MTPPVSQGMFGPLEIIDHGGIRAMRMGSQIQGSCFLDPKTSEPTDIAFSSYCYGWLLAGVEQPSGSGLMIGLGSGIGAVMLLSQFEHFDLTLVEIDPKLIEVATQAFPFITKYMDEGRLNIVCADAKSYCEACTDTFDCGFADAYDGSDSFALVSDYLPALQKCCKNVIINVIDGPMARNISALIDVFKDTNNPIKWGMQCICPRMANVVLPKANFILTTIDVNWQDADAFLPFADLTGEAADHAKQCWTLLISQPVKLQEDKIAP